MLTEFGRRKSWTETAARYVSLSIGAAVAIGLVLWLQGPPVTSLLLASLGGSTVFLFGLTSAPAAQPRALFGGHFGCALIGIVCYQLFGDASWAAAMAIVLSLLFMLSTKTVHPPAGANPLIMIYGHAGFSALWQPVGCGVLVLFLVVFIWSRLDRRNVRYPVNWLDRSPPSPPPY
jgi:CBS-domain-containing membrane protein